MMSKEVMWEMKRLFHFSSPLCLLSTHTRTCAHSAEPQTARQRQLYIKVTFGLKLGILFSFYYMRPRLSCKLSSFHVGFS